MDLRKKAVLFLPKLFLATIHVGFMILDDATILLGFFFKTQSKVSFELLTLGDAVISYCFLNSV